MLKRSVVLFILIFITSFEANAALNLTVTGGDPVIMDPTMIGKSNFSSAPIELTCGTDGNPWELSIEASDDLIDSTNGYSMLIRNLKWYGYEENSASGGFTRGTGGVSVPLTLTPETFFSDTGAANAVVKLGLGIVVPEVQPRGSYSTTVRVLLTD